LSLRIRSEVKGGLKNAKVTGVKSNSEGLWVPRGEAHGVKAHLKWWQD